MKAKDFNKIIPSHVRITKDITYEVVWLDDFIDKKQLGECRYNEKQIVIKKNQSNSESMSTFIHEALHAVSFETKGLNLTEGQVYKLERSLFRMLKLNNIFDLFDRK